jgi:hypothetical protein
LHFGEGKAVSISAGEEGMALNPEIASGASVTVTNKDGIPGESERVLRTAGAPDGRTKVGIVGEFENEVFGKSPSTHHFGIIRGSGNETHFVNGILVFEVDDDPLLFGR